MISVTRFPISVLILFCCHLAWSGQAEDQAALYQAYDQYEKFFEQGDLRKSLPEAKRAYELGKQLFGRDSEDTANLAYNYANNLVQLRDYEDAKAILAETLDSFERVYGDQSIELLPVLMALGTTHTNTHNKRLMKKHYARALRLSKRNLGQDSAGHGWYSVRAGADMLSSRDGLQGEKYLRDGYRILRSKLGKSHERTAFAAYHLGKFEVSSGDYYQAKGLLLEALATVKQAGQSAGDLELGIHRSLITLFEELGEREAATRHCLALGRATPFRSTAEYSPVYTKPPEYPRKAWNQALEGNVVVEFSVDERGFVLDPVAVDVEGHKDFAQAAIDAARTYRYAPRFVDQKPVAVEAVLATIYFRMDAPECGGRKTDLFVTCVQ